MRRLEQPTRWQVYEATREHVMATILDISGKPLPNRKRTKSRLKAQDARDLFKIIILLAMIIVGFFLFAPDRNAAEEIRIAAAQRAQG